MAEWPIVGHALAVRQMRLAVERGEVPHALLITGPERVGKTTLARTLAMAMLCTSPDPAERPCGQCSACRRVQSGNHPDLLVVEPATVRGPLRVDQVREAERFLAKTPYESRYKVVILAAFERANASAANALLKTLEEPPLYAHLVLTATDAEVLLPTIASRSQQLPLRPVPEGIIAQALTARWGVAPDEAERIARLAGGRVGWAVQAAQDPTYLQRAEARVAQLFEVVGQTLPARFEAAASLARDKDELAELLEQWRTVWRDVLLLRIGAGDGMMYTEYEGRLSEISRQVSLPQIVGILRSLERALHALAQNANARLLVEALFLDLPSLRLSRLPEG